MDSSTVFGGISEEWRVEQQFDADHWWPVSSHPTGHIAWVEVDMYWQRCYPNEVFRVVHVAVTATEVER